MPHLCSHVSIFEADLVLECHPHLEARALPILILSEKHRLLHLYSCEPDQSRTARRLHPLQHMAPLVRHHIVKQFSGRAAEVRQLGLHPENLLQRLDFECLILVQSGRFNAATEAPHQKIVSEGGASCF